MCLLMLLFYSLTHFWLCFLLFSLSLHVLCYFVFPYWHTLFYCLIRGRACVCGLLYPSPLCVCVWISRIFQFFPHRSLVFSLLSYDVCFVLWTVEKVYALAEQLPQCPLSLVAFALTPSRTCGSTKDAVRGDTEERSRHTCIRAT